jgi:hypothetical protein
MRPGADPPEHAEAASAAATTAPIAYRNFT